MVTVGRKGAAGERGRGVACVTRKKEKPGGAITRGRKCRPEAVHLGTAENRAPRARAHLLERCGPLAVMGALCTNE